MNGSNEKLRKEHPGWRVTLGTWMFALPFVMFFGAPVVIPLLGLSGTQTAAAIGGVKGNIYIASPPGVQVFSEKRISLGVIDVPEQPYNVTFGGSDQKTLFVTASSSVYAMEMEIAGHVFPAGSLRKVREQKE